MSAESETQPVHVGGITIQSDRATTLLMAVLFVSCGLFLAQEIHSVAQFHFYGPERLRISYWSIFHKVFEVIVAIYFFMFAFSFPKKSVKIASVLIGANYAGFVMLSFFPVSSAAGHIAAMSGSVVRQLALIIFCVAIALWFKSVVHWRSQSEPRGGEN